MKKNLPQSVQQYFAKEGAKGGRKRAKLLTAEQRKQIATKAGKARSKRLTAEQRKQIAQKAAAKRWGRGAK